MVKITKIALKVLSLIVLLTLVFLISSCARLNLSLDGVAKEDAAKSALPQQQEALVADQKHPVIEENTSQGSLTGNAAAEIPAEGSQHQNYTVKMTADGFSPDTLHIKAGDTVVWKNVRSGSITKAMIIGVRECHTVRSGFFKPGESFSWTFNTPMTCTIADGILTTKESKVYVE